MRSWPATFSVVLVGRGSIYFWYGVLRKKRKREGAEVTFNWKLNLIFQRDEHKNEVISDFMIATAELIQGDHGSQRLGFVDYDLVMYSTVCPIVIGLLKIWAEMAEHLGSIVEFK